MPPTSPTNRNLKLAACAVAFAAAMGGSNAATASELETIGKIFHGHTFREGDRAGDRRRWRRLRRLLRTLQRIALLRGLHARRTVMLLLRAETGPLRHARTLRHATGRTHRL